MASKVAIANFALAAELGVDQITSLSDDNKAARLVSLYYDDTAKEVMSMGAWSSATFRQTLAQDTTAPGWQFSYRYVLPTNPRFLGLLKLNELKPGDIPHKIESGYLLTDEASVKILYKGFQADTETYSPELQRAIVLALASRLCYALTGNVQLKTTLLAEFQFAVDAGLASDGMNSQDDDLTVTDDLKDVRR